MYNIIHDTLAKGTLG